MVCSKLQELLNGYVQYLVFYLGIDEYVVLLGFGDNVGLCGLLVLVKLVLNK